jgi:GNAT superfamily N-acetyltransferase
MNPSGQQGVLQGAESVRARPGALAGNAETLKDGTTLVLQELDDALFRKRLPEIFRLEEAAYEPTRRHTVEYLEYVMSRPGRLCLVALQADTVVGFALAAPLEHFPMKRGTQADVHWGKGDTLYSADIVVVEGRRGQGIARLLKTHQVEAARRVGFRRATGRNRIGVAVAMWAVNISLGARVLQTLKDEYMDDIGSRDCWYYEIDLQPDSQPAVQPGGPSSP